MFIAVLVRKNFTCCLIHFYTVEYLIIYITLCKKDASIAINEGSGVFMLCQVAGFLSQGRQSRTRLPVYVTETASGDP